MTTDMAVRLRHTIACRSTLLLSWWFRVNGDFEILVVMSVSAKAQQFGTAYFNTAAATR